MRVAVIGATGGTGKATVEELLAGGHEVTAFARHATSLELQHDRLRKLNGDAMEPHDVERAVADQDAVVVVLGVNENPVKVRLLHRSNTPVNVCSVGTAHVIDAMKRHGIRKLVVQTAYGTGPTWSEMPLPFRAFYRLLLKDQIADKEKQENFVEKSGLDWVIVRPVGLTNRPPRGEVHATPGLKAEHSTVTRKDLGHFLSELVPSDRFVHQALSVSS